MIRRIKFREGVLPYYAMGVLRGRSRKQAQGMLSQRVDKSPRIAARIALGEHMQTPLGIPRATIEKRL